MFTVHLTPTGALYVGTALAIDREITQDYVPSDTLYSALVSAWAMQGTLGPRLAACLADPPALRVSSAFPRVGGIRLYPMPIGARLNAGAAALTGKARKRVRWVSEGLFSRLLTFADVAAELDPQANFAQSGAVWMTRAEIASARALTGQTDGDVRLWSSDVRPRVTVDRAMNASNYFETARHAFAPGCGLWFLAQGDTAAGVDGWVRDALQLLRDSGLGGLRSTGHGAFDYEILAAPTRPAAKSAHAVLLSRFSPADEADADAALRAPGAAYAFDLVGGWCTDDAGKPWRRRAVRLVREGSVVGAGARGAARDVMPRGVMNRPVFRFGLALALPIEAKAVMTP